MGEGVSGSGEGDLASAGRGGRQQQWGQDRGAGEARGVGGGEMTRTEGCVPAPGYDVKGDMDVGTRVILQTSKMGKKMRDPNVPKKNMSAYLMYQNTMR